MLLDIMPCKLGTQKYKNKIQQQETNNSTKALLIKSRCKWKPEGDNIPHLLEWLPSKREQIINASKHVEEREPCTLLVEM